MANRNWASGGKIYSMHVKPVLLDCNFVVDSTNGNGLGIRNLKGPAIKSVFMHTTAPLTGSGNPNPAAGYIEIVLQDNYNRYYGGTGGFGSPLTGSPIAFSVGSGVTAGEVVVLTSLGTTTTAANFVAAGIPASRTPAVGMSFVATAALAAGTGLGNATFSLVGSSGVDHIEVVGDPNVMNSNLVGSTQQNPIGMKIFVQCLEGTTLTAPANGTVVSLQFYLGDSAILLNGE